MEFFCVNFFNISLISWCNFGKMQGQASNIYKCSDMHHGTRKPCHDPLGIGCSGILDNRVTIMTQQLMHPKNKNYLYNFREIFELFHSKMNDGEAKINYLVPQNVCNWFHLVIGCSMYLISPVQHSSNFVLGIWKSHLLRRNCFLNSKNIIYIIICKHYEEWDCNVQT